MITRYFSFLLIAGCLASLGAIAQEPLWTDVSAASASSRLRLKAKEPLPERTRFVQLNAALASKLQASCRQAAGNCPPGKPGEAFSRETCLLPYSFTGWQTAAGNHGGIALIVAGITTVLHLLR